MTKWIGRFWSLSIWQPPRFIGFRICAVLIALLVWLYVMVTQNPLTEDTFTVPIEMRNLSSQLAIPAINRQVTVRVQGSSGDIGKLSSKDIDAYIDFEGVKEGEAELPVTVTLPAGITLISQTPESMAFTLEAVVGESYDLTVQVIGEPMENYTLLDAVADPNVITLSGSEANIRNAKAVFVSADVTELAENYSKNLAVEVLDANGNNITDLFTITPATVNVLIPVVFEQPEKSIAVREVIVGEPALGYQVSRVVVQPATVRVFGDLDVLNALYYLETSPIDVSGLKKTTSMTAAIQHGNNISLSAETVTVVVQIEPVDTLDFQKGLLYGENLAEGLHCDIPSVTLNITVSGPGTYIGTVSAADVVPYLDFSDITAPGVYVLPVSVSLPVNISLAGVSPGTVQVEVIAVDNGEPEEPEEPVDEPDQQEEQM